MPSMANITVKANDGTTNVVYTALNPSAGDGVPARWRNEDLLKPPGYRPWVELLTTNNGTKTARRMELKGAYPYAPDVAGVPSLLATAPFAFSITLPQMIPQGVINEAVAQQLRVIADVLVIQSGQTGSAPG